MEYIQTDKFRIEAPTVVTIGKFDGRHRGHQKLLQIMAEWKKGFFRSYFYLQQNSRGSGGRKQPDGDYYQRRTAVYYGKSRSRISGRISF